MELKFMQLSMLRVAGYLLLGTVFTVLVLGGISAVSSNPGQSQTLTGARSGLAPACANAGLELATSYGRSSIITAAFLATAGQVAYWQEKGRGPTAPRVVGSQWRTRSPDEPVSVCYYDGLFDGLAIPGGPPGIGATTAAVPVVDRIVVLVDGNGQATLYAAGPSGSLPIEDPTKP